MNGYEPMQTIQPLTIKPPVISRDIWGDEEAEEKAYYTVRYYNASGVGIEMEWKNIYGTEAEAKDYGRTNYRIGASNAYRLYAFKQSGRI